MGSEMCIRDSITAAAMAPPVAAEALCWTGTFHAIGTRILREHALAIGLHPDFSIHDREDSADLMNLVRNGLGLSTSETRFPTKGTCLAIYSRAVNSGAPLSDVLRDHFPWCAMWANHLRTLFGAYVIAKQTQNVLDYDGLLLAWAQVMADPGFAAHIGGAWDHVLIDEYQDTNRLQARILAALKPDGHGLTVVGDDAQSIYAFRAADVRNILDFPDAFSPPAEVITLERNYRSTQPILTAANAVIAGAAERFTKDLWSDRASADKPRLVTVATEALQARYMVDRFLEDREGGMRLKDQAVLFRTSSHAAQIEAELTRRNVPYVKFGGLKFLDSAHVKDLLSVLRLARNPRDRVAGFRVLQLIPGVGPTAAGRILDALDLAIEPRAAWGDVAPPPRAGASWQGLVDTMTTEVPWPAAIGLARAWYDPHLDRIHEDTEARRADLLQLEQIATGYPSPEAFLTDPGPARRHERSGRRAPQGRGLPDPVDHLLRQRSLAIQFPTESNTPFGCPALACVADGRTGIERGEKRDLLACGTDELGAVLGDAHHLEGAAYRREESRDAGSRGGPRPGGCVQRHAESLALDIADPGADY